jgi:hypothetical protein
MSDRFPGDWGDTWDDLFAATRRVEAAWLAVIRLTEGLQEPHRRLVWIAIQALVEEAIEWHRLDALADAELTQAAAATPKGYAETLKARLAAEAKWVRHYGRRPSRARGPWGGARPGAGRKRRKREGAQA